MVYNRFERSTFSSLRLCRRYLTDFVTKRSNFDVGVKEKWALAERKYNLFTISYFLSEFDSNRIEILAEFISSFASNTISAVTINDNDRQKVHSLKHSLFENLSCNVNLEFENKEKHHCGFFYEDKDRDFIQPKLNANSIRYAKVINI
ncbi:MAG: hypothetical protein V2B20_08560 [Pseudomonadota bacterium]